MSSRVGGSVCVGWVGQCVCVCGGGLCVGMCMLVGGSLCLSVYVYPKTS